MRFGKQVRLDVNGGADSKGRNAKDSYVFKSGQLTGAFKMVTGWHGIGHTVCIRILFSSNFYHQECNPE